MDDQPPSEPRSHTRLLRDLYGLAGVVFLLFLLLGGHGLVSPADSFLTLASQAGGSCPLNLDPENARLSASVPLKLSRASSGAERGHAAFVGVNVVVPAASSCLQASAGTAFVPVDAPPPVRPGHDGPASFALPPPLV